VSHFPFSHPEPKSLDLRIMKTNRPKQIEISRRQPVYGVYGTNIVPEYSSSALLACGNDSTYV